MVWPIAGPHLYKIWVKFGPDDADQFWPVVHNWSGPDVSYIFSLGFETDLGQIWPKVTLLSGTPLNADHNNIYFISVAQILTEE